MDKNFQALLEAAPRLLEGIGTTLFLTAGGAAVAFAVALSLGLMAWQHNVVLRASARVVIEFFRGTSLVVQLFWFFFVLPQFGIMLDPLLVGVLALGVNYGAYGAEAVRGSISSVSRGQWEATHALSMSSVHRMRRIIFPQAWALMLPSLANLLIHLLKGTAIVSFITLQDFTFHTDLLRIETDTFFALGLVAMVGYFLIAYVLTLGMNALEVRAKHKLGRGLSLRQVMSLRPPKVLVGTGHGK